MADAGLASFHSAPDAEHFTAESEQSADKRSDTLLRERIDSIKGNGLRAKGKSDLLKHLEGKRLSYYQAMVAKCYECMGYYIDGRADCSMPTCPLHPYMPHNSNGEKRTRVRRGMAHGQEAPDFAPRGLPEGLRGTEKRKAGGRIRVQHRTDNLNLFQDPAVDDQKIRNR